MAGMRNSALTQLCPVQMGPPLRTQECCRDDGNPILPSIRAPAGRDDRHVRQDGAELLPQPQEMAYVRVRDLRARLYFEREHALVACLDDEVDLAAAVVGAAVIDACFGGLRIDAHGLSDEGLEHLPEKGSVSGGSVRWRNRDKPGAGRHTAEQSPRIHAEQACSQCWINQLVLWSLSEAPQMVLRRDPSGNLIENPQLLEHIAIGDHRGFRRDFLRPLRGSVA